MSIIRWSSVFMDFGSHCLSISWPEFCIHCLSISWPEFCIHCELNSLCSWMEISSKKVLLSVICPYDGTKSECSKLKIDFCFHFFHQIQYITILHRPIRSVKIPYVQILLKIFTLLCQPQKLVTRLARAFFLEPLLKKTNWCAYSMVFVESRKAGWLVSVQMMRTGQIIV